MSRKMKDSGVEWIGEIPEHWECHPVYMYFCERKSSNYLMQEQNLLSLSYGKIIRKDINSNGGLLPASYTTYNIVEKDDIIIRPTDLQNDKRSLRTGLVKEHGIITSAYIALKPKFTHSSKYYHYMLHTADECKVFYNMGNGVRQGLNFSEFSKLMIPSPPLSEQQSIADYLDKKTAEIDAAITEAKSLIDKYKAYKQSVITETVTKGLNPDVKMKDSGVEWIGEIPEHWNFLKGKYLFQQRYERGNSVELQLLSPTQKFGCIPQSLYEELTGANAVKLNEKTNLNLLKTIHIGDYCISLRSFQGGFEYSKYEGVVSPAYQVFYPIKSNICRGYYKYMFKDGAFIDKMNSFTLSLRDGKNIAFADFGNTLLPLPSLSEQQAIADYLDKKTAEIDAAITEAKSLIDKYKAYKQSVITETVTKGLNPDVKMKDSGVEWIGEIPATWEVDRIKYHLKVNENKGYPEASVLSLYRDLGVIPKDSRDDNHNVTSEDTSKYKHVEIGNFVINKMKAWQGSVAVSNYEGIVSPAYYVYKFTSDAFYKKYFHYLLRDKSYTPEYRRLSGGIREGQWDLSREGFTNLPVIVPPLSEQQAIADYLDTKCSQIDTIISQKEQLVTQLQEYKKSIIFEYVTGKKEVPNA